MDKTVKIKAIKICYISALLLAAFTVDALLWLFKRIKNTVVFPGG